MVTHWDVAHFGRGCCCFPGHCIYECRQQVVLHEGKCCRFASCQSCRQLLQVLLGVAQCILPCTHARSSSRASVGCCHCTKAPATLDCCHAGPGTYRLLLVADTASVAAWAWSGSGRAVCSGMCCRRAAARLPAGSTVSSRTHTAFRTPPGRTGTGLQVCWTLFAHVGCAASRIPTAADEISTPSVSLKRL